MEELEELQGILAKSPNPNRRAYPSETCAEPPQCAPGQKAQDTEFCQWVVEANGSFSATGATVAKLPAGIYSIVVDGYGVIHAVQSPALSDELFDLDDTAGQRVIAGIRSFWQSRDSFRNHGILFKRGVLLWGPAGSGKTATVYQLMRELVSNGGVVILCDRPTLTIGFLKQFRKIEHSRPLIVVLEDIEEMIEHQGEHDLLALLDGEHQVDNVVHIATTNYPERLGSRIVNRPSRFDEVIKVGMPSDKARRKYLSLVLAIEIGDKDLDEFVSDTKGLSIAHLRELVVATTCLGRPYRETIERLKKMQIKPRSGADGNLGFST